MKNGNTSDQLNMQEWQISDEIKNKQSVNIENKFANKQENNFSNIQPVNQDNKIESSQSDLGLSSVLGIFTPEPSNNATEEQPIKRPRKKKKPKRGLSR